MSIAITLSCPLGHKCEQVIDGEISKCAWFVKLRGINPNTNEEVDEFGCAMSWLPVLMIENSQQQRSTSSAVESLRNEIVIARLQQVGLTQALSDATRNNNVLITK